MSLKWIYEVEDELRTWEDYYEARPFLVIDAALRDALVTIIPATHRVGRKVRAIRYDYEKRKDAAGKPDPRYLKGRQILNIIYDHYKIADVNHRIKELEDLIGLKMQNNDLIRFHDDWLFCLLCQKIHPNWEFKLTRYYGQVKKHPDLEHDMATYHRFGQDNVKFGPGFTDHESDEHGKYEWLITCVDNLIDRKRENTHINNAAHGGPNSAYATPKKSLQKAREKKVAKELLGIVIFG